VGALPGDRGQLLDRAVERLGLGLGLADAHVQRDLLDARDLHHGADAELVLQVRADLLLVAGLEPRLVAVRLGLARARAH
jgi:hypothetical protein